MIVSKPVHVLGLVLALAILGPGQALRAAPLASGLVGAETDDSSDPGSFQALLAAWPGLGLEADIPLQARRVVDGLGHPLPAVSWRLSLGGTEEARGLSYLDGSILLPSLPPGAQSSRAEPPRLELSARGAARVVGLGQASDPGPGPDLVLEGSRPLPSPLPCDVVFVLDTTVSMAPRLPTIKRSLFLAMDAIAALGPGIDPRFGLVLFRDSGEDYLVRLTPLSSERSALDSALAGAAALGGGDQAEDLGAGLRAALADPGWRSGGARIVIALTDAQAKPGLAEATAEARRAGVRVCAVGLGPLAPEAEFALRKLAALTGAPYIAADLGSVARPRPAPGKSQGAVRGSVEGMLARIVGAELALAQGRAGGRMDPALELLDQVQARMAAGLAYPEAARLRGISGTVGLAILVDSRGGLSSVRIASASGSAILDKAALDLATQAFPQPNPAGAEVELEIRIVYRLGK